VCPLEYIAKNKFKSTRGTYTPYSSIYTNEIKTYGAKCCSLSPGGDAFVVNKNESGDIEYVLL